VDADLKNMMEKMNNEADLTEVSFGKNNKSADLYTRDLKIGPCVGCLFVCFLFNRAMPVDPQFDN